MPSVNRRQATTRDLLAPQISEEMRRYSRQSLRAQPEQPSDPMQRLRGEEVTNLVEAIGRGAQVIGEEQEVRVETDLRETHKALLWDAGGSTNS